MILIRQFGVHDTLENATALVLVFLLCFRPLEGIACFSVFCLPCVSAAVSEPWRLSRCFSVH